MAFRPRVFGNADKLMPIHRYRQVGLAGLALLVFNLCPVMADACAFDMVKPEKTQIDRMIEAERLVLARPGLTNGFQFEVTTTLVGPEEGPPIRQLVDSTARRRLASNPSDAVLFGYSREEGWTRIAYIDESSRFILDAALENRSDWRMGMTQGRLGFITELQARNAPADWSLIIGELDKVPYPQLREMDLRISDDKLRAKMWTKEGYRYQAILALLAGLSGTPKSRDMIHAFIERAAERDRVNNLGAFAAAYLELEGVEGAEHLEQAFLMAPAQSLDRIEQIVMAMSVHHGLEDPELRNTIHAAIGRLVAARPEAGAVVARQFSLRSDWSQASQLEPLVRDRQVANMTDMLTISVYLGRAREAALMRGASDG